MPPPKPQKRCRGRKAAAPLLWWRPTAATFVVAMNRVDVVDLVVDLVDVDLDVDLVDVDLVDVDLERATDDFFPGKNIFEIEFRCFR